MLLGLKRLEAAARSLKKRNRKLLTPNISLFCLEMLLWRDLYVAPGVGEGWLDGQMDGWLEERGESLKISLLLSRA